MWASKRRWIIYYAIKKEKDLCNGVIGHSWVIEALLYLHMVFKEEKYLNMAAQIASKHSFDERLNLWAIPNKVPTDLTIDYTFNHQLWYAASLAELNNVLKNTIFQQQLDCFILSLDLNMTNSGYGKIAHTIYRRLGKIATIKSCVKRMINLTNDFCHVSQWHIRKRVIMFLISWHWLE